MNLIKFGAHGISAFETKMTFIKIADACKLRAFPVAKMNH